jgi:Type IV secretion system pilin
MFSIAGKQNENPLTNIIHFLNDTIVDGLIGVAIPITILCLIACIFGLVVSTDDYMRSRFKKGMIWTTLAFVLVMLAGPLVDWLKKGVESIK